MVKQTIVLVVVEDEKRFRPNIRVGRDRIDFARDERGTIGRHVIRVLRLETRGNNPGNGG